MRPDIARWLKHAVHLLVFSISTASIVSAQVRENESSLERVLSPGLTVWITDSTGREVKTRIVSVSGDVVTTDDESMRRLSAADIRRIQVRRSDSVINGALIGAGAAIASGLFLCTRTEPWANCRDDVGPIARIGAIGAGVGIGIDALIRGRTTIYEAGRPSVRLDARPMLGPRTRGFTVSVTF
jgi:hypothetical protein